MVIRDIKPCGLAIHEEKFFFWRVIFPTHLSRAAEVDGAGLDPRLLLAFAIPFRKPLEGRAAAGSALPAGGPMILRKLKFVSGPNRMRRGDRKAALAKASTAKPIFIRRFTFEL